MVVNLLQLEGTDLLSLENGTEFEEIDTGKRFVYNIDNDSWVEIT